MDSLFTKEMPVVTYSIFLGGKTHRMLQIQHCIFEEILLSFFSTIFFALSLIALKDGVNFTCVEQRFNGL